MEEEGFEEPLSYRRQRNKKAEEELHHISEKLSHRLEELDQVCGFCILSYQYVCFIQVGLKYYMAFLCYAFNACNNLQCVIPVDAQTSSQ